MNENLAMALFFGGWALGGLIALFLSYRYPAVEEFMEEGFGRDICCTAWPFTLACVALFFVFVPLFYLWVHAHWWIYCTATRKKVSFEDFWYEFYKSDERYRLSIEKWNAATRREAECKP